MYRARIALLIVSSVALALTGSCQTHRPVTTTPTVDRFTAEGFQIRQVVFLEDCRHILAVGVAVPTPATRPGPTTARTGTLPAPRPHAAATMPVAPGGSTGSIAGTRPASSPTTRGTSEPGGMSRLVRGRDQRLEQIWPSRAMRFFVYDVITGACVKSFGELTASPSAIALIPGTTHFAALSREGLSIWDHAAAKKVRDIDRFNPNCNKVTVSGDGRYIAITSGTAIIFGDQPPHTPLVVLDLKEGKRVPIADLAESERPELPSMRRFLGPGNPAFTATAFSPDGKLLAAATTEYTFSIRVWRVPEGREVSRMFGHTRTVRHVAFSKDGLRLFSCGDDRTFRTWDALTGDQRACQDDWRGAVTGMSLNQDRTLVALATEPVGREPSLAFSMVELRRSADGVPIFRIPTFGQSWADVAISPDGKRVATASGWLNLTSSAAFAAERPSIRLWPAETAPTKETTPMPIQNERPVVVFRGHVHAVSDASFSPDGKRVYTVGVDQTIRTWDAATGRQLGSYTMPPELQDYTITRGMQSGLSEDGRWALYGRRVARDADAPAIPPGAYEYVLHDLQNGRDLAAFPTSKVRGPLERPTILPDGKRAILGGTCHWLVDLFKGDVLQVYDPARFSERATSVHRVNATSITADGARFCISTWNGGTVLDVDSAKVIASSGGIGTSLSPDGKLALSTNGNGLSLMDVQAKSSTLLMRGVSISPFVVAWSHDGKRVAVVDNDLQVHVLNTAGKRLALLRGPRIGVTRLRFDATAGRLLASSLDGVAWVWELPS